VVWACLASLSACDDSPPLGVESRTISTVGVGDVRQATSTGRRREVDLFGLQFAVEGPLLPGRDLSVRVRTWSAIEVESEVTIRVLDLGDEQSRFLRVDGWRETTSPVAIDHPVTVRFAAPGYYRVLATATLRGPLPDSLLRSEVARARTETMWLLIDESGGRRTIGFDSTAIAGRRVRFGAYGPFQVSAQDGRSESRARSRMTSSSAMSVFGTFEYFDASEEPVEVDDYVPVKGGRVEGSCIGRSSSSVISPDIDYPIVSYVGSNGTWTVTCPSGVAYEWDYASGNIYPNGQYADVRNHNSASVGSSFFGYANDNLPIHAASNPQGFVLSVLEEYVPQANTRFARSRSKVVVRVHDTDSLTFDIFYNQQSDFIQTNFSRTTNTLGFVTTLHEYGHAFHYVAIEQWKSFSLSGGEHGWFEIEHISGSFVEGFANFFAAIIGEAFTWMGALGADYNVETQPYHTVSPDSVSGWRIEGAVAGFLYDLVDTPSSLNDIDNTSDGVDDDSASFSLADVATVIVSCSVDSGTKIDGIDQFIYCAEQSLAPQSLQHPTYAKYYFKLRRDTVVYSTVSVGSHSMSPSTVRAVWLKNMFGL